VGQWLAGPSFNQGVGGSIPTLVDVSFSKTLNSELLPVARCMSVYECNMIVKVRSHQKRCDFLRRPKRVSLLARPFAVFSPSALRRSARGGAYLRVSSP